MDARASIDVRLIRSWLRRPTSTKHSVRCRDSHDLISNPEQHGRYLASVASLRRCLRADSDLLALPCLATHERVILLDRLARGLQTLFSMTRSHLSVDQAIELRRDILSYHAIEHAARALACLDLAALLGLASSHSGNMTHLEEAIALQREALRVSRPDHHYHARARYDLIVSLRNFCQRRWDAARMEEAIILAREGLEKNTSDSPDRGLACHNLAASLIVHARRPRHRSCTPNAVAEIVLFAREAWRLLPAGHPAREECCRNLSTFLFSHFSSTGVPADIDEATVWSRHLADIASQNHRVDPVSSYSMLARILRARSRFVSDHAPLNEALQLDRRIMQLRPVGHHHRDQACEDVANSLKMLARRTGDMSLLEEAIAHEREALTLRPLGHWKRDQTCQNLAFSLYTMHDWRSSPPCLDEAIALAREALALRPEGHRNRGKSCATLATALRKKEDPLLLAEIIELYREAMRANGPHHPIRARQCAQLGDVLLQHSVNKGDTALIQEAESLHQEALALYPVDHSERWHLLVSLAQVNINPSYPKRNLATSLEYLRQAIAPRSDGVHRMLHVVTDTLQRVEQAGVDGDLRHRLLQIYSSAIELAISITGYALSGEAQLEYLTACRYLGPAACTLALNLSMSEVALEVLERARGIVWAQQLQVRDPHLDGAPVDLRSELVALFAAISGTEHSGTPDVDDIEPTDSKPQRDVRHQQHGRIQEIVQGVRALPGMERFLRGPTCAALMEAARDHPVVTLFTGRAGCCALVIKDARTLPHHLPLLGINEPSLRSMGYGILGNSWRGSDNLSGDRAMVISRPGQRRSRNLERILATLWKSIVRPILEHIGLMVGDTIWILVICLMNKHRASHAQQDLAFIGVQPAHLRSFQSMRPECTVGSTKSAAPILSSHHTRRP
jgi:tetratricopeptide (TPR) repeat protein